MSTRHSTSRRTRLDRDQVIDTAIALADEQGLEGASMRGVAERLNVTPMALYKHVSNHSQLIDNMLDRVISAQGVNVDTVSGATHSSEGILEAIADALGL